MKAFRKQLGLTYLGILVLLLSVAGVIWVAFKVAPPYFNNRFVTDALSTLADYEDADGGIEGLSNSDIRSHLRKYFSVNNMRDESIQNIEIDRQRNKFIVKMNYEIREPFFENIDIVFVFKNEFDSSRPHECCDPVSE
ncbi:hypothetical protein NBRC116493_20250 [Aurantivibrio infirmus]